MKCETETRTKHGCCHPQSEVKTTGLSKALGVLNQHSITSSAPLNPLLSDERRAVEAHKLQVEQRRSIAIEYARRNTYR